MPQPDLSIVIVSWNVAPLLRRCLTSIEQQRQNSSSEQRRQASSEQRRQASSEQRRQASLEVIVVDAASDDGSPDMVRSDFPWVHLEARSDNVGFPRGNNIGLGLATGRYILLLNPDTEVLAGALSIMVRYLADHPDVGVVGSRLLYPDGSIQSSRRRFPTLATAFFESTWLQPLAPKSVLDNYYARDLPEDVPVEVDWVMGACLMTRREIVTAVGPMDEAYFMYSEELDWCRRIKGQGWQVVYLPDAQVIHHEGKSSEQAVTARHINFQRAKLRYFRKYHGRAACLALRLFLLFNYAWQLCLEGIKGLAGHKRPLRWQRVSAYWQVLRSGLRPAGY